jgi:5-oxopent-3-ene-1,2,5-tricarboxylate decarboxylase/2-hydroxyhepta-2,4-diene-1,7-dioate isomerase
MLVVHDALVHQGNAALANDLPMEAARELLGGDAVLRVPVTGSVYGVLMNDPAALTALGEASSQPPYKAPPKAPVLYLKPRNTLIGHGAPIPAPAGVEELSMGPSLGIVIGRTACRVKAADAASVIAGYVVVNDVCIPHASFYRPSVRLRARDGFCPVGPWVRAASRVGDPDGARVRMWIDGELAMDAIPAFQRPIARLIEDVTDFMTLQAGDVLLAGQAWPCLTARPGQLVEIEIDGVGRLSNRIVQESMLVGEGK